MLRKRMQMAIGLAMGGIAVATAWAIPAAPAAPVVTVYKSPTCGCCSKWVDHLKSAGFQVKAIDREDMDEIKALNGVTDALASCHTALVGGYVVEGHVPAADIQRLLKEKPKVAGLAAPGMPMGSPGMEGSHKDAYDVVTFDKAGRTRVWAKH